MALLLWRRILTPAQVAHLYAAASPLPPDMLCFVEFIALRTGEPNTAFALAQGEAAAAAPSCMDVHVNSKLCFETSDLLCIRLPLPECTPAQPDRRQHGNLQLIFKRRVRVDSVPQSTPQLLRTAVLDDVLPLRGLQ